MQAVKMIRIGECVHGDIIRIAERDTTKPQQAIIAIVQRDPNVGYTLHHVDRDGEYTRCYELHTNIENRINNNYYVHLINIRALVMKQYDPTEANVFADFLEENGHVDAANLLRKEFPLLMIETNNANK